jgi:multiple sugar transport system permease protein
MVRKLSATQVVAYIFVGIGALVMLAPFFFMFVFATHTREHIFQLPPPLFFGVDFGTNIGLLLDKFPTFWRSVGLSVYIAMAGTALTLFLSSLGGYAFAMYEFRYKKTLFAIMIGTILIPPFLGMIPNFIIMNLLGWLNEPRALYIPGAASAGGIFLMRQYITSAIPRELVESARMDGCSEFRIYWNIVLPLTMPALGTVGLISFIGSWNNFIGPLVVMTDPEMYTLPLALRSIQ